MATELAAGRVFEKMVELRRAFHREPELAFEERKTATSIIAELERLGIPFDYGGVGSGIVGRLEGPAGGPTIALRADMDALPGAENTDLPFASRFEDRMHACGHDAHMAMVLGACALLVEKPPAGTVLFVFQPAEERGGGSRVVLASGALDHVDAIFGGHVTHHYRVGQMMISKGIITAQSDRFTIRVRGRGGHGARPHEAIDAVLISGLLVAIIQTIVSRYVNPIHPSVVTVGLMNAGTAANVIAEEAQLEGSIRSTVPDIRARLHEGLRRICESLATLFGAAVTLDISEGYPPVVNTLREAQVAQRAARGLLGPEGLISLEHPSMGSEDFSYYLQKIPGCYVRFGARAPEQEYVPLHSPAFDIDERVLAVGASFFDAVVREAMREYAH